MLCVRGIPRRRRARGPRARLGRGVAPWQPAGCPPGAQPGRLVRHGDRRDTAHVPPSLTHTQLRFARLQGPAFAPGQAGRRRSPPAWPFNIAPIVLVGWLALGLAAGLLVANLVASVRAAPRPLSLPSRLITLAQAFLLAGVALGIFGALGDDVLAEPRRAALAVLPLAGWLGLTVLASLLQPARRAGPRPQPLPRAAALLRRQPKRPSP